MMTMKITPNTPALAAHSIAPTATSPSGLDAHQERMLSEHRGAFLDFGCASDPLLRELARDQWTDDLADYLANGYMESDDPEGAVQRLVPTATHAEGVAECEVNLVLRSDVRVLGFLDNQGVGDCYYLYRVVDGQPRFYGLCIESGTETGGPYDIFVTEARDWQLFLDNLPST